MTMSAWNAGPAKGAAAAVSGPVGGETLTEKVVKGSTWLVGLKIGARVTGLASTFVLARLLSPADFGVLGVCLLAVSLLETFSQTGFESALVHKKGDIGRYLDTAFLVSALRGVILGLSLFVSAPLVAAFFDSPPSGELLRFLALMPVLGGLCNVGMVVFQKELHFRKLFLYEISSTVSYLLFAVPLAYFLRNAWALAWAVLAGRLVTLAASYVLHPYRPVFRFDATAARELFSFGKWLFWTHIILYFINEGQNAFVGKMLGTAALGCYAMAYKIAYLPVTEITFVVSRVMFPAYSKIQDNPAKTREVYNKTIDLLAFVSIPASGMIYACSPDFVSLFLGQKWADAVPVIRLYAFTGFLVSIGAAAGPFLYGVGKPRIVTYILLLRLLLTASLIYPLTLWWGLWGTALSVLLSTAVVEPLEVLIVARLTRSRLLSLGTGVAVPFVLTVAMVCLFEVSRFVFAGGQPGIPAFLLLSGMAGLFYLLTAYLWDRWLGFAGFSSFSGLAWSYGLSHVHGWFRRTLSSEPMA